MNQMRKRRLKKPRTLSHRIPQKIRKRLRRKKPGQKTALIILKKASLRKMPPLMSMTAKRKALIKMILVKKFLIEKGLMKKLLIARSRRRKRVQKRQAARQRIRMFTKPTTGAGHNTATIQ